MILLFLLRLIAGLAVTWCLLPRRMITSGFFRIQMLLTLGLSVLGFLMLGSVESPVELPAKTVAHAVVESAADVSSVWEQVPAGLVFVGMAVASFVGSVLWTLERRTGGAVLVFLMAFASTSLLVAVESASSTHPVLSAFGGLTAAWLSGGVLCAMLLGHWYLTATGMALEPLQVAIRLATNALLARVAFVLLSLFLSRQGSEPLSAEGLVLWLTLRALAGLGAQFLLLPMAQGTLRYRNTQAVTGVLFAASVLVFIGESAALLLTSELKWPF